MIATVISLPVRVSGVVFPGCVQSVSWWRRNGPNPTHSSYAACSGPLSLNAPSMWRGPRNGQTHAYTCICALYSLYAFTAYSTEKLVCKGYYIQATLLYDNNNCNTKCINEVLVCIFTVVVVLGRNGPKPYRLWPTVWRNKRRRWWTRHMTTRTWRRLWTNLRTKWYRHTFVY